jgi:uncharacterized integral membrane protein
LALLRQLLLLPLLAPLLAVMLLGAMNPRPAVGLRLLTWTTPALPIGVWMLLAAGGGGILSATATGLALRGGSGERLQRQVRRPIEAQAAWAEEAPWPEESPWPDVKGPAAAEPAPPPASAGPSRAPGEPAPTVEVPFRVIRRGQTPRPPQPPEPAVSAPDDWSSNAEDDW